jgi:hypothetical protein
VSKAVSFPILNLRTARQREKARRARMRVQERLEVRLARTLRAAFRSEAKLMLAAIGDGTDYQHRITQVLYQTERKFRGLLRDGILRTAAVFGAAVFGDAKSAQLLRETKDSEDDFDAAMRRFAEEEAGAKITRIQRTTKTRVRSAIEDALVEANETGERASSLIFDAIQEEYDGFSDSRAYTIARTETHNAAMHASHAAAEALEIPTMKKTWTSAPADGRNREYHLEMDGTEVALDDVFQVQNPKGGTDEMQGPGDTSAPAEQVVNCRCVLTFATS